MKQILLLSAACLFAALSCSGDKNDEPTPGPPDPPIPPVLWSDTRYPVVESTYMPLMQSTGDMIPDFSRVGYRWGDTPIPSAAPAVTLSPPAAGEDATALIQNAINSIPGGVILLTKGTYNISGSLKINKSGIVLRGEGDNEQNGTVLIATGTTQRDLITIGGSGSRKLGTNNSSYDIADDYVPVGRFWVKVKSPDNYSVGDNVVIYRPSTQEWITDLKMDQIPPRNDGQPITQWSAGKYDLYAERVVTMVKGDTVHFENPIVMSLDQKYGGGRILHYSYTNRISECGVENMLLKSDYNGNDDEDHGWIAIAVKVAEHCWVRNVTSRHFGKGLVDMDTYSKNISVLDCTCLDPVSIVTGSRRYGFHISEGQLCLVKGCRSDKSRHDYVTGSRNCGPNVFTDCAATNTLADTGPHQRWNTGTLYDNITSDGEINVQDRSSYGSGQGWAGANNVLWNCAAKTIIVQSPWVSAYNWCVGSTGQKSIGKYTSPVRPDGVWYSHGNRVSPASLYEAQLSLRRSYSPGGVMDVK